LTLLKRHGQAWWFCIGLPKDRRMGGLVCCEEVLDGGYMSGTDTGKALSPFNEVPNGDKLWAVRMLCWSATPSYGTANEDQLWVIPRDNKNFCTCMGACSASVTGHTGLEESRGHHLHASSSSLPNHRCIAATITVAPTRHQLCAYLKPSSVPSPCLPYCLVCEWYFVSKAG